MKNVSIALFSLFLLLGASAGYAKNCTNQTLTGTYTIFDQGTVAGVGEVTTTGILISNGTGGFYGKEIISINGQLLPATVTGTYSVNKDCTGTAAFYADLGNGIVIPRTISFQVEKSGSGFTFVSTVPGDSVSGVAYRIDPKVKKDEDNDEDGNDD